VIELNRSLEELKRPEISNFIKGQILKRITIIYKDLKHLDKAKECNSFKRLLLLYCCVISFLDGNIVSRWGNVWCCYMRTGIDQACVLLPYDQPARTVRTAVCQVRLALSIVLQCSLFVSMIS
jgi:hypothetical protein